MPRFAKSGEVLASDEQGLCSYFVVDSRSPRRMKTDLKTHSILNTSTFSQLIPWSAQSFNCKGPFSKKSVSPLRLSRCLPIKLPPRLFGRNISRMRIREIFQFLSLLEDRYLQPLQICQREASNPELQMSPIK